MALFIRGFTDCVAKCCSILTNQIQIEKCVLKSKLIMIITSCSLQRSHLRGLGNLPDISRVKKKLCGLHDMFRKTLRH